jgi:hypothetical protein
VSDLIWIKKGRVAVVTPPWQFATDLILISRMSPLALEPSGCADQRGVRDIGPLMVSVRLGYRFNLFVPRVPEPAPVAWK